MLPGFSNGFAVGAHGDGAASVGIATMPNYEYEAIGTAGRHRGFIEADNERHAAQLLAERNEVPIRTWLAKSSAKSSASTGAFQAWMNPVTTQDIVLFSRQFSTMVQAGISAANLMAIMEEQSEHPVLRAAIGQMRGQIQQGQSFSDTFAKFPHIFSPLYCSMVHAGEVSGTLPEIMDQVIAIMEHEDAVRKEVRKALQYPKIVLMALVVAFVILLVVVFPKFAAMYVEAGLQLPLPTRMCIALSDLVVDQWMYVLPAVLALGVGLKMYFKTPGGRLRFDRFALKAPIFGPLVKKMSISRFASIFSVMQANGINVVESLQIIKGTIGNLAVGEELDRLVSRLSQGQGLAAPMRASKVFTPMLVNMVALGEETGNMAEMLKVVAGHYDVETKYAINRMVAAIGPLLTVVLAIGIGFFALAIYMPMWDMVKMVK
jgi:type II secretory pathway component PulF